MRRPRTFTHLTFITTLLLVTLWTNLLAQEPASTEAASDSDKPAISESVVVTASRTEQTLEELAAAVTLIDREDLRTKASQLAGDELQGIAGVFQRREEAANNFMHVVFRGLTGNHGNDTFLALVDGIPFVSAHEEVLLAEVPFGAVDRVEVVRGPVSALYGRGSLSGAVNYLTRDPGPERRYRLGLSGGSYGYAKPHLSVDLPLADGRHQLVIDGYRQENDGWRDRTEGQATNLFVKDHIALSERASLTLWLNAHDGDQEAGGVIPILPNGDIPEVAGGREGFLGYGPNEYQRETLMAAARHRLAINDNLMLISTLHYRRIQDDNDLAFYDPFGFQPENNILRVNGFANDRDTRVFFVEPQLSWQSGRHNLIAGATHEQVDLTETDWWTGQNGFDEETFNYHFYEINIDYTTGEVINRDHPLWADRNETYRGDSRNSFTAFFVQDQWQLSEDTTVTLGARWDRFERDATIASDVDFDGVIDDNAPIVDSETHVSPKLSIVHFWKPNLSTYFSYGQGFNSNFGAVWQWDPSLYQRGSEVKPSRVDNYDLGIKGHIGDHIWIGATLFHLSQRDRLVFLSNPAGQLQASTADRFQSQGLEWESRFHLVPGWSGYLTYTYTDAEWEDYQVRGVDYTGNRPTGVPEHMGSLGLRGSLAPRLTLDLWSDYADDYMVTLGNDFEGGGYTLVHGGLTYRLPGDRGTVTLTGKNLLDETYDNLFGSQVPLNAYPGSPIRAQLDIRLEF
ncbi:TonB-dependent receptor [Sulfidibacter corallicola]|uniref:TonB-dependent receptor n=1 Tax=Sulfidibacter corallicola TaxID=2818388 RepID=A0A8A4TLN9_SULCO|nr:TonB-dependent receptor [Sulfidibacter corallicola]QTD49788.1 TonB-dependent receptor [Sulfidibacter corallicola]